MFIVVNLTRNAADLLTEFSAGAKLYLESATSSGGVYTLVTSTALVAGTEQIEFVDTAGTSATWYKSRVGNTGATLFSDYSDPFQATSLTAYASLDDLLETMSLPDASRHNVLSDLLADAAAFIDGQCGRRFYRDPQVSGTTTKTFRIVRPSNSLVTAIGRGLDIVSVTSVTLAASTGATPTTLLATDYYLPAADELGFPSSDMALSDVGSYGVWPYGYSTVSIVGVFGFSSVPAMVRRGNIDLAREWFRQGPGGGPAQVGVNQFGTPVYLTGLPSSVRTLIDPAGPYVRRSWASI